MIKCKVVLCQSKAISITFFPFSLSLLSSSSLLKLPIVQNVFALFPSDAFFDLERLESKCGPEGTNASNAF